MPRKIIDEKTKQDVIQTYENGIPRKKIAEEFGISLSSVGRIVRNKATTQSHEKKTVPDIKTEKQKRIEDLERKIAEVEKKILKFEAYKKSKSWINCLSKFLDIKRYFS